MMKKSKFAVLAFALSGLLLLTHTSFAAGSSSDEEEETDWKTEVMSELEDLNYEAAFKRLLKEESDQADTSADWNNLMGYSLRMMEEPDLAASEEHYIKAVELEADHKGALEYYGELKLKQDDLEGAKQLMARLTEVCPDGCDELDTLTKAVEDYEAKL